MDHAEIARRAAALNWYHTFDLPGGVTTPGLLDHRRIADKLLLPQRLDGLRCLDAASADGFFAFELKRRGAAEVVSIDGESNEARDFQGSPGFKDRRFDLSQLRARFDLVREATGLQVERIAMNLYDISPEQLGKFDLVFLGNVLLHLRNPQAALHSLWTVCRGELISFETVSLAHSLLHPRAPVGRLWDGPPNSFWWTPNVAGHRQLVRASGFEIVEQSGLFFQPLGVSQLALERSRALSLAKLRYFASTRWLGVPSSVVRARPVATPAVQ